MAAPVTSRPALEVANRGWLTGAIMLATIMQVLDTTIANVALPHMAASLGASQGEITWVLTSYIVAAAIMTPMSGWIVDRMGRKRVFIGAIAGFVASSMLCGLAQGIGDMVLWRIMQGIFGAVIAPMAQSVIMDINPREKLGQAMAIYGAGIMVGPIIGPTLGGWLTESFDWRWVFFINLPVGGLALVGIAFFMPHGMTRARRFDIFGFAMLALAVGGLQLLLDRGEAVDWFESPEIWIYLGLTISGFWVFVIHALTAGEPFIDLRIFRDRNFVMGNVFMFVIGLTLFSGLALLPPLLQNLMGYPVITTGIVMAPRGIGTMLSMVVVGRLVDRLGPRLLVFAGLSLSCVSLWMMTGFETGMDDRLVILSGVVQGFGMGFVFVPLTTLAFATLSPALRGDGTSVFSLVRNMGSGIGISLVTTVLTRMLGVNHAELASRLPLDSPQVAMQFPALLSGDPAMAAVADGLVSQQAAMLAYIDNFLMMMVLTLVAFPIVLLLRNPSTDAPAPRAMAEH
ncbi:MAG: multidrug efflux MFS transporter [Rubellimicrobium sp.]|nr:multidrug efflux MFS transporter [Rubellimicrobium sp.]